MGKRQHQKDKMYITYTEWTTLYGGKRSGPPSAEDAEFRRLPFDHCAVSLQPFEHPYCDLNGNIFELQAIVDFLKQHKVNPVTGKALDSKTLIKLKFHKNAEGKYHCPVMFRQFTKNSHIVAIATTGNVFSWEAVEQLNLKPRNWKDLITDETFEKKDIITLQDPSNLSKFNLSSFHHIKHSLRVETEEEIAQRSDPTARLKTVSNETKAILSELNSQYQKPEEEKAVAGTKLDKFNAAHYSTGMVAAGLTSTVMEPLTEIQPAVIHEDLVRYERVKKKGYVRVVTNLGPLNLELFCDVVPKTCENFLKHCQNGYYDGTKFHRSIRNFMLQGGDPTGKGIGGKSIWGGKFEDEIKPNLNHAGRGVLSMANAGPNTNGSQFFITYRSCRHLDGKHTVFGKVVGGIDTLQAIERIEVDNRDRPIEDIIIQKTQVFVDPYQEADEQLAKERADELQKAAEAEAALKRAKQNKGPLKVFKEGVGKYINPDFKKNQEESSAVPPPKKKKPIPNELKNFNSW